MNLQQLFDLCNETHQLEVHKLRKGHPKTQLLQTLHLKELQMDEKQYSMVQCDIPLLVLHDKISPKMCEIINKYNYGCIPLGKETAHQPLLFCHQLPDNIQVCESFDQLHHNQYEQNDRKLQNHVHHS